MNTAALRPLAQLLLEAVNGTQGALPDGAAQVALTDVMAAAALHRVRPALRNRVAAAPDAPQDWLAPFETVRHQNLFTHMRAHHDLRTAAQLLDAADVRWLVAKGPVLSDLAWPRSDMREYGDVDLFLHPSDFKRGVEALESHGFSLVDRNWPEMVRLSRSELAMRGPSGVPFDVHWDLTGSRQERQRLSLDLASMIERSHPVILGPGYRVPTFEPTDTLLHVSLHAAQSGANRLVWLADTRFAAALDGVDWSEVDRRSSAMRSTAMIGLVLARTERVFGRRLPAGPVVRRRMNSLWASLAARRDRQRPFPGLPGDRALGGILYSSARDNAASAAAAAVRSGIEVRRLQSRAHDPLAAHNPLDDDVPDARAREHYMATVGQ
ncbi:nucleotidyltransferase family protein [Microbacterium aurum]|uniref:nucleotidyltransferase family protein n=1 Tax=uncultured Microbacterium sp. TaxID=191216 RepID=UPI002637EBA1|nr:nucleotidyltransferase family protein [uncultured Microbacterium sp.]